MAVLTTWKKRLIKNILLTSICLCLGTVCISLTDGGAMGVGLMTWDELTTTPTSPDIGLDGGGRQSKMLTEQQRLIHKARRDKVRQVCQRNGVKFGDQQHINPDLFHNIYVDDKYKFLYCAVPKVACTNWKRILLKLSGKLNYHSAEDIPPFEAHNNEELLNKLSDYTPSAIRHMLKSYFKFMFVREPLERLVSAYSNKFSMSYNDYFTRRYGRTIIKRYRKNARKASLRSGRNVTFPEFVKYVTDPRTERPFNEHWREYYKLCYPCMLDYDVIGKYEFLQEDVAFVFAETGIGSEVTFPHANRIRGMANTSSTIRERYSHIASEDVHKLWETYSVDYAMFDYVYPDVKPKSRRVVT